MKPEPRADLSAYRAPWWLPGGHAQTIWPALLARRHFGPAPQWRRERWIAPDGDFIDVDHASHAAHGQAPRLVLFHGLEGSSASQYAVAFADFAAERGLAYAVPHFRGCSGEMNRAPRAYHSGDFEEIDWILRRFAAAEPQRTSQPSQIPSANQGPNATGAAEDRRLATSAKIRPANSDWSRDLR